MLGVGGCDFLHIFSAGLNQSSGNCVDRSWLIYPYGFCSVFRTVFRTIFRAMYGVWLGKAAANQIAQSKHGFNVEL